MCLRGYIMDGTPRKSPITALTRVGTRFPQAQDLHLGAYEPPVRPELRLSSKRASAATAESTTRKTPSSASSAKTGTG